MTSKTSWLEGIRGLAALQVMTHHLVWTLKPWRFHATVDDKMTLMQWPFLRAFYSGSFSVDEFVLIAAFVSAIKPLRQTRAYGHEEAMSIIAKAAFKRTFRLVIPVILMTTIAWLLCQLGAFTYSHDFEGSGWIRITTPARSTSFWASMVDLVSSNFHTWSSGSNNYEKNFWLMKTFYRASFFGYIILLSTTYVRPSRRFLIYAILYMYCWLVQDHTAGINTIAGLALAELHQVASFQRFIDEKPNIANAIAAPLIVTGLFCASCPPMSAETIGWSKIMMDLGAIMTPAPTLEFRSLYFVAVGAQMIITGVSLTTFVQRFLSLPWLVWLGKVSWPLYLIHGTCIRTILVFVLYAIINGTRTESPQAVTIKENITIAIILPLFYVLVYYLAHLWSLHIDPLCDNVTKWMEQKVFLHDQQPYDDKEAHYMALPQAVSL